MNPPCFSHSLRWGSSFLDFFLGLIFKVFLSIFGYFWDVFGLTWGGLTWFALSEI